MCKNKSPGVPGWNINCKREEVVKGLEYKGLRRVIPGISTLKLMQRMGKAINCINRREFRCSLLSSRYTMHF